MAIQTLYPNIEPSLNLSFALTKALDPRITFTRTTTATYYNGVQTAKAEENLLLQSQDFTTSWMNQRTTDSANTTAAPDGTTTADTITETIETGVHNIRQEVAVTSGLPYVFSVFVKKGDGVSARDYVQLSLQNAAFGSNSYANFDILNGTVTVTGAGLTSASITDAGNGWWRCVIIDTASASTTNSFSIINITTNTAVQEESYTGVTTANIFLWGAQVEQRSAVTDYTPTTTQPITNYIPVLLTAASGVARFDHNPTTGESLGLLVEEQRTNLLTYSAEFDNAAWTKNNSSITANTIVAPDGTLTGDKIIGNSGSNGNVSQSISFTSGTSYAASFFAKKAEFDIIQLRVGSSAFTGTTGNRTVDFNLTTGTVSSVGSSISSGSITPVGNGWYRCIAILVPTSTASDSVFIRLSSTGDGYSGVYIWGAQLEAGAFPTSYIPTVAASVTRNADAASMTGTNFTSWFNNAEGTLYAESSTTKPTASGTNFSVTINDVSNQNFIGVNRFSSSSLTANVAREGVTQAQMTMLNPYVPDTFYRGAIGYKTDNFAAAVNGGTVQTDTSGVLPSNLSRLSIGTLFGAVANSFYIRKLAYYPIRATNAQLQALTS
jgi:hypothetical protein